MEKELIVEGLENLGFDLEDLGDGSYVFQYEGFTLLLGLDDDDPDFLRVAVPNIYTVDDEENSPIVLHICNEVNCRIKYTKALLLDSSVWIVFEHRLSGMDNLEDFLRFSLRLVQESTILFYRLSNGGDAPNLGDDEDNDDDNTDNED